MLCDYQNNYYLDSQTCVKNTDPHCIATKDSSTCIACKGNYYPSDLTCVSITQPI